MLTTKQGEDAFLIFILIWIQWAFSITTTDSNDDFSQNLMFKELCTSFIILFLPTLK